MPRGGARVGAGRPKGSKNGQGRAQAPRVDVPLAECIAPSSVDGQSPLDYMLAVMRDPDIDESRRDRMAVAAAPYLHGKVAERGSSKKGDREAAAKAAAGGQFGAGVAPRLVVNNR